MHANTETNQPDDNSNPHANTHTLNTADLHAKTDSSENAANTSRTTEYMRAKRQTTETPPTLNCTYTPTHLHTPADTPTQHVYTHIHILPHTYPSTTYTHPQPTRVQPHPHSATHTHTYHTYTHRISTCTTITPKTHHQK